MVLICIMLYLLALVVIAAVLSRRMQNLTDFFLAGRTLPTVAITMTFVAAWFGAGSTIGTMNEAFHQGVNAVWLIAIPSVISCLVIGLCWAKKIRSMNHLSQPDAVEAHYGAWGSFLLAWIILASTTTFIASQLVAGGALLEQTAGLSPVMSITLMMGVIVLYSILGGFRAVVMTDVLQFFCFTAAILLLFGFALSQTGVDLTTTQPYSPDFLNPFRQLDKQLAMVLTFVLAWSIAPEMWQRMTATQHHAGSRNAALYAGLMLMGLYALVILTGMLATKVLSPTDPNVQKHVLLSLALSMPSPLLTAMVLVGVLSAITSTIDSSLNVATLTLTRDIVNRWLWRTASEKQLVFLSRVVTALVGLPAIGIALFYQDLIRILWMSADIYASTMFIPMIGVFYNRGGGTWSGPMAMGLGAIPVSINLLHDLYVLALPSWWPGWPYTTLLGVSLSLLGFLAGRFLPCSPKESKSYCLSECVLRQP